MQRVPPLPRYTTMSLLDPRREDFGAAILVLALIVAGVLIRRYNDSHAQSSMRGRSLNELLVPDPDGRAGTLDNGLRYYVRANEWPKHRAELRLVVDVGAVVEEEDQRGLAYER